MSLSFLDIFSLVGPITLTTYIVGWIIFTVLTYIGLGLLTNGHCWHDTYGAEGAEARNLAIAIVLVGGALAFPEFALTTRALQTTESSQAWLLLIFVPVIVQPVTQWFGLNGSLSKPTLLGMVLSFTCLFGVIVCGIGL